MSQTYFKFYLTRGFSEKRILFRHAYKPVLHALLSIIIARLAWVMGGSAVLEFTFAIPGISYFLVDSMNAKDYYVLQSYVMIVMLWMFGMHVIINLLMRFLEGRGGE
ncbi:ABC transporter permease subunit [Paenibacillus sp. 1A_MP2]|uniref:ABC transporter permease subunit n=1 Tax=Paenibacillus sp. 1A_MP2 TaxID=3457495 RepID=UPI003FCDA2C2